ncbi:MAG: SDR family oxidoreductase [Chitinophagaceae bacterium]|nr:MAG: SDR family oxidoreductase [Chitinophagaceae bacterium]
MSTILVTGANGFLGYYLVQQLLQKGHGVIATGKGANRLPFMGENFQYLSLDFTNKETVAETFAATKPGTVVHCGAISKPDECELAREAAFLSNVTGTLNLLEAAAVNKTHFIFLSTDFVFSGDKGFYKEDDHRAPVNYYGQTKLLAEDEVMKYPFTWSIVRTVLAYGKTFSGRENIVTNTAKALREGKPLKIFTDQERTPTYIEDLAAGIVTIIEKGAEGIYHMSGEDVRTPYDVAIETAQYLRLDASLITAVKAEEFDQPAARPPKTGFNISKAKRDLAFRPLSFAEGLRKTFL